MLWSIQLPKKWLPRPATATCKAKCALFGSKPLLKSSAKELQDALLTLFRQEYGRQPAYNKKVEVYQRPDEYMEAFAGLKKKI